MYQKELREKSEQLKDLNKTKAELLRTQREKGELKTQIEAESELKLSESLISERAKMRKDFDEKSNLKIAEKEHLIESLKTQIQSLTIKIEQGSMQLQGEVQEIAIENYLRENFPLDSIDEIKKGARGADCLQTVNSRTRLGCGSIYYESKRTKEFACTWIEKFRNDMREKNANFGVLVTDAYPSTLWFDTKQSASLRLWICRILIY